VVPAAVSLKRFVAELESMLAPMGEQQLRAAFLAYATALPARARDGFLADLATACTPSQRAASDDADLITAIEAFTADVESGIYYDGWGWDPDLRHERAFGDESWAPRMDELFSRAAAAFLAGRHDLSAEAYRRLFAALALEGGDGSLYSCEFSPAESLTTDLAEAGARWLRSLYETAAHPAQAAAAMAEAWLSDLPYGQQPRSLTAVREALPADLAGFTEFCPSWTRELVRRSGGHDPLRGELLREAARLAGGTEALSEAARHPGPGQPRAYLDLVDTLTEHGDQPAALQACRQGLRLAAHPDEDGTGWAAYQWAPLADRAASMAIALADPESATHLRIQAFTLAVSTIRLVALYQAAETHRPGTGPQAAGQAADRLAKGEPSLAHYHLDDFRAQALLLAGRIDDALDLLATCGAASNGSPSTIMTVMPYALAASSGAASRPDWPNTVLHTLLNQTADAVRASFHDDEPETNETATLASLLQELLRHRSTSNDDRIRWRRACRMAIDQRIRNVLAGKQRAHYAHAARLATALTEAEILTEGNGNYLDGICDTYRRYTAFRRAVETARRGSTLL
jgi:hypothetical protein